MAEPKSRLTFQARGPVPLGRCGCTPHEQFYLEELLRHRRCLEEQREHFSEQAIRQVESALSRIISRLEHLCRQQDADQVVGTVLRKLDVVTRLSSWDEPRHLH
ncbi:MAG: hypothetical protein KJ066_15195 [Acidobacteria bacterium]|nr:hypothetical protein [Acidobacteriota bacterium]